MNNDEDTFLRAILADPEDTCLRLVYADWLEERSDPRSEFLRLESALADLPPDDERRTSMQTRLQELRSRIDPNWQAWIDRARIENCDVRFAFQCPQRWEKLKPTDDPRIRFCETCRKDVFHCSTVDEARRHARQGNCVVIDSRLLRSPGDTPLISEVRRLVGGRLEPPPPPPWLAPGRRVTIRDGCFRGLRGEVGQVTNRETATVIVRLLGQPTSVEMEWWQFELAE